MNNEITINALKFDHKIHRSWKAELIAQDRELLIFVGRFEAQISHPQLGVIRPGTLSYEYYWLDRWFNVFRFHEPEGGLRNFYCNINMPPKFGKGILSYIDLDIDILVRENYEWEVLDLDEFEDNSRIYGYPINIIEKCHQTIDELKSLIESRRFPFDFVK